MKNQQGQKEWHECMDVWGPHYWFVLHSIARTYPNHPTNVSKKKYYEFIQNIPVFLPNAEIGDFFSELLEKYPVTSYLDSKMSLMKWLHFIHNKINRYLNKETISFNEATYHYMNQYNQTLKGGNKFKMHYERRYKIMVFLCIFTVLSISIYFLYKD